MTAKIKLNAASGGGSFSLQAPSSSSNNRVLTLPDSADGTIAKTSDINFTSYAIIVDQKSAGTGGGTFSSGSYFTRDLNTILSDPDSIVTISSNEFTLQAGTYFVKVSAPAFGVNRHKCLLRNQTDGADITYGTSAYAASAASVQTRSFISSRFTLTGAKALRIRHKCDTTKSGNGYGVETSHGIPEIYTIVEIFKEL